MKNLDKKAIIFDFDGVFVDDFDFHKSHIEKFLGIKITDEEFYKIHSGNVYNDDGDGLELGSFDIQNYCKQIKAELVKLPLVKDMDKVIEKSKSLGQSFIVSSGCEYNIKAFFEDKKICLENCKIYGVETNPSKEKKFEKILQETNIPPENLLFVTDTLGDILEANELGIASIAVTWGFQRIETLERGAPFGFAHNANDVQKLIERYFMFDKIQK